ncbi:TMEM175 family protein [Streptomyces luteolifulvus]|jgi:uncharacterized membrane protein|uniref:TMEM175 family protein n=1 Tax=Streptomyces luteolifulvus TaxID=2615112 RepID=UPI0017850517|nr:TMEM175 family protein [Streptomyces luteolifulvus]
MWKSTPDGGPERLLALADGVYAIAITLLVLDLSVPRGLSSSEYRDALSELLPNLGAYGLSLWVLGEYWRGHRSIFRSVRQVDAQVIGLSVLGLGVAALVPFPTKLVAEYATEPASVAIYAAAVAALGATHLALLLVLARRPWLRGEPTPEPAPAPGTTLYAVDLGSTVVIFLLTIPLALTFGSVAMLWWLVMIPTKIVIGRWGRATTGTTG